MKTKTKNYGTAKSCDKMPQHYTNLDNVNLYIKKFICNQTGVQTSGICGWLAL